MVMGAVSFLGMLPAKAQAPAAKEYRGHVGRLAAVYSLRWWDDGRVTGTYHYPARPGVTYTLKGRNDRPGQLYLEEYTGSELSARCHLAKSLQGGAIVWSGMMNNTDGRRFQMALSRARDAAPAPAAPVAKAPPAPLAAPPAGSPGSLQPIPSSLSAGCFRTNWTFYELAERVGSHFGCTLYEGKVVRIEKTADTSRITFLVDTKLEPRHARVQPFEARLEWKDSLGPPPFTEKLRAFVSVDSSRNVHTATVFCAASKWRNTPEGAIEFLVADPEDSPGSQPFVLRPVKWGDIKECNYFIAVRDLGAVMAIFEAGAAMMELEEISLTEPAPPRFPWISLNTRVPDVPASQFIAFDEG